MTREEAHEYLEDVQRLITQWRHLFPEKFIKANGQAILALEQPEQKKAKWVFGTTMNRGWMKCSNCCVSQTPCGTFSYCPNCGAKMVERSKGNGENRHRNADILL